MPGQTRGSAVSTTSSACVPPVEVPMATTLSVVCAIAWFWPPAARMTSAESFGGLALSGASGRAGPRRLRLALDAALIAWISSPALSSRNWRSAVFGLVTMAKAPAASTCIAVSEPRSVSVEQMTTGVGRLAMIFLRKVTPSMRGISTSSTMTSGQAFCMRSSAKIGSGAVAMTSMPASSARLAESTWRTTAESSTIITLMAGMLCFL